MSTKFLVSELQNTIWIPGIRSVMSHIFRFPSSRKRRQLLCDYDGCTWWRRLPCRKLKNVTPIYSNQSPRNTYSQIQVPSKDFMTWHLHFLKLFWHTAVFINNSCDIFVCSSSFEYGCCIFEGGQPHTPNLTRLISYFWLQNWIMQNGHFRKLWKMLFFFWLLQLWLIMQTHFELDLCTSCQQTAFLFFLCSNIIFKNL